ncbi:hypothetical protein BGX31_007300 [Mortierella sp. GBA43]|nr:hypothetical protein BGX31_007300 [Mortierella sp. GBA43]
MGVFVPLCVVRAGKSLYAFTKTRYYHDRTYTKVYMLAKSNENPSYTLDDLTWTAVSVIPSDGYIAFDPVPTFGNARNTKCAVDVDTGVFTVFNLARRGPAVSDFVAVGMQYFPPGASGGNPQPPADTVFGTGIWRNITFPPDYHLTIISSSQLFNYKDSSGKMQLMHVFNNRTDFYVATLDPVTMTMNQGASWTTNIPGWAPTWVDFDPLYINVMSQSIYVLSRSYALLPTTTLYQFPLNSANPASPLSQPIARNYDGTLTGCEGYSDNFFLLNYRENPLLVCEKTRPTTITLINGAEIAMRTQITEGGFDGWLVNAIEVVDNPPAVPYVIYQDMNTRFFSVPISGQFAGVKFNATRNMTVMEDYGDGPPKTIPTGHNNGRSDSGSDKSSSSTGAIAGGVCAAVVVIVAALGFLYYRRRRSSRRGLNNHQDIGKTEIESSDL